VYLIVFNKSASDSISAAIHLAGFSAEKALYWEVNGSSLDSNRGVIESERGATLQMSNPSTANHIFPAHSMTAIEFKSIR
jgi:hypothetical protein